MHAKCDAEVPLRLRCVAVVGIDAYRSEREAIDNRGFTKEIDALEVFAVIGGIVVAFVDETPWRKAVELGAELERGCDFPDG